MIQASRNFVRMFIFIKSRPEFKVGHVRSERRSLGQFLEKQCVLCSRHSFDPIFMKLCKNVYLLKSRPELKKGHVGSKTRSLGQIFVKPSQHSTGHSFDPIFMKLCQNVCKI